MRKPRSEYPSEQSDKFLVRLPEGMRERITEEAKRAGRSMNAEIVHRLEQSFHEMQVYHYGNPEVEDLIKTVIEDQRLAHKNIIEEQRASQQKILDEAMTKQRAEIEALLKDQARLMPPAAHMPLVPEALKPKRK